MAHTVDWIVTRLAIRAYSFLDVAFFIARR
jgi:hypothetical protein